MCDIERVRCRKCRKILLTKDEFHLLDAHGHTYDTVNVEREEEVVCASIKEHSCLYFSEEFYPDFILSAVDESSWTKGKIHCPGCQARLGSFNFVSGSQCACGFCVLPQVHILSSKVDWMKMGEALPRPLSSPDSCVSPSLSALPLITPTTVAGVITLAEDDVSPSQIQPVTPPSLGSNGLCSILPQDEKCRRQRRVRQRQLKQKDHGEEKITEDVLSLSVGNKNSRCVVDVINTTATTTSALPDMDTGAMSCCFKVLRDEVTNIAEEENSEKECENDDMLPENLMCPVCLDLLYSPLVTRPCSHTFCEPCLRRLAHPDPTHTHCPLCRRAIGHCMPAPEVGSEARKRFPEVYKRRRQFELQNNSQHLPLPWLRNFRLRELYDGGQNWVERAGGWQTMLVMMLLNILGIGLLLYLGRPIKMEPDPHLYPDSTLSLHQS